MNLASTVILSSVLALFLLCLIHIVKKRGKRDKCAGCSGDACQGCPFKK